MLNTNQTPEGYRKDARGNLVAIENIKELDLIRDELVITLTAEAKEINNLMLKFKYSSQQRVRDFIELAAQEHEVTLGGKKGNVSLTSFDGAKRVQVSIADNIVFDEKINLAKELIDQCLVAWSKDSNANIKAIVNRAFDVNQSGRLNKHSILGLRSLKINDDKWQKAMELISLSLSVSSTREYIRFYSQVADKEEQIKLDLSSI